MTTPLAMTVTVNPLLLHQLALVPLALVLPTLLMTSMSMLLLPLL